MSRLATKYLLFTGIVLLGWMSLCAQEPQMMQQMGNRIRNMGGAFNSSGGGTDSLQHRDKNADSITISFRYLDSTRSYQLDTSVGDFHRRYPVPATWIHLGNTGNAAKSLLFLPEMNAGFDPGFHAFDVYKWKMENVRFFTTTRPYSELNYFLGSRTEQIIELLHTQNIKPNWNFSFQYRLINGPG
ncbi:MAG TPA: hypothetical protein PKA77_13345, partial [Chitinophagaceae bacterium]|nr:hypothetical protein [Chitinophagaceae bacterium]